MEPIQKILTISILSIFLIGLLGFTAYSQGETEITKRMLTAQPYQTPNHVITPEVDMKMISHTEYWSGETGKIAVRLVDNNGNPITVTSCNATIKYPDTTPFVTAATMTSSTITGNHYYDFTVPTTEGVYEYSVTCYWNPNKEQTTASSFHVSPALNMQKVINSTLAQQTITLNGINTTLASVNTKVTNIYNDTQYIRTNMLTEAAFAGNMTQITNEFNTLQTNVSQLFNYCGNPQTTNSPLCTYLASINTTLAGTTTSNALLSEINATTHSTYTYMTTTLFNKVNDVFGLATDINNTVTNTQNTVNNINSTTTNTQTTVNNINTTVGQTNTDVQYIKDLLNNQTLMTVSSG
jgi:hypothetical protein